jgi:hypothetical protein
VPLGERVQLDALKSPDPSLSKPTLPLGVSPPPLTVTSQFVDSPRKSELGVQSRAVPLVPAPTPTLIAPELSPWAESPP